MSAILQMYTDPACLNELSASGLDYEMVLGPTTGLDGDAGDRADALIYVRNTGDQVAVSTQLVKDGDPDNRIYFRLLATDYSSGILDLGDIAVSAVVLVYIRLIVLKGTVSAYATPNFNFKYKSLP